MPLVAQGRSVIATISDQYRAGLLPRQISFLTGRKGSSIQLETMYKNFLDELSSKLTRGFFMGSPSSSYHRSIRPTIVLFPEPEAPTIAVCFPAGKLRDRLFKTFTSCLVGYAKLTLSRTISPVQEALGGSSPLVFGCGASIMLKKTPAALAALTAAETGAAILPIDITMAMMDIKTLSLLAHHVLFDSKP